MGHLRLAESEPARARNLLGTFVLDLQGIPQEKTNRRNRLLHRYLRQCPKNERENFERAARLLGGYKSKTTIEEVAEWMSGNLDEIT